MEMAPYVSIWRVSRPPNQFLWVITGDLPADHVAGSEARSSRQAMNAFSSRWGELARAMLRGESHPKFTVGRKKDQKQLGNLLGKRANILAKWSKDDSLW
jgi:hypothetical protein